MRTATVIGDERGMATSLLECVVVIAIVAVVSSVAFVSAMGHVENAKMSRAAADTEMIGISIHSFIQDTGFAPAFKAGNTRSRQDEIFFLLETEGSNPQVDESLNWPLNDAGHHDSLENQLVKNQPAGTGAPYPRIGQVSYAPFRGWNGPYAAKMPSSDPWDDKYLVNIQMLTPKGVQMAQPDLRFERGQRAAVFVISAGPNRTIETKFDQVADAFARGGDDIIFRIQ